MLSIAVHLEGFHSAPWMMYFKITVTLNVYNVPSILLCGNKNTTEYTLFHDISSAPSMSNCKNSGDKSTKIHV